MKTLLCLCLLACVGFAGWHYVQSNQVKNQTENQNASDAPEPVQPQITSASPSPAVTTPSPVAVAQNPTPSASASPTRHLAPAGTVFLLAYRSVRTPRGFTGFAPGTSVDVAADKGATLLVQGEGLQFEVSKSEVTNDLDLAEKLAGSDSQEQAALFSKGQAESSAYGAANLKQMQAEADSIQKAATSTGQRPQVTAVQAGKNGNVSLKGWNSADRDGRHAVRGLGPTVAAAKNMAYESLRREVNGQPYTIISEECGDRDRDHPYRIIYTLP